MKVILILLVLSIYICFGSTYYDDYGGHKHNSHYPHHPHHHHYRHFHHPYGRHGFGHHSRHSRHGYRNLENYIDGPTNLVNHSFSALLNFVIKILSGRAAEQLLDSSSDVKKLLMELWHRLLDAQKELMDTITDIYMIFIKAH